jgi:hypothetical protein
MLRPLTVTLVLSLLCLATGLAGTTTWHYACGLCGSIGTMVSSAWGILRVMR